MIFVTPLFQRPNRGEAIQISTHNMYAVGQVTASGTFQSAKSTSQPGSFYSSKSITPCSTFGDEPVFFVRPPDLLNTATPHWSSPLTARAVVIGTLVAAINGSLDMYSLFRSHPLPPDTYREQTEKAHTPRLMLEK